MIIFHHPHEAGFDEYHLTLQKIEHTDKSVRMHCKDHKNIDCYLEMEIADYIALINHVF